MLICLPLPPNRQIGYVSPSEVNQVMLPALTPNEEAQTLQTIEMFEVIAASDPSDCEALEILREAYFKLGRDKDVIRTTRRIADAYVQLGQISSAILEFESILRRSPGDADARAALEKIDAKTLQFKSTPASPPLPLAPAPHDHDADRPDHAPADQAPLSDGREIMRKLFVDGKHLGAADFDLHWVSPAPSESNLVEPFILRLAEKQLVPLETALKLICDKSHFSFIPLDRYDIDIELARSYPRELCQRWCILPFDRLSKSVLVAAANPFNEQAARDLERFHRQTDNRNRIQWYVASPPDLLKAIRKTFR